MTGRIGTWHRRYRVCGTADYRRADALADGTVLAVYEDCLKQAFGDGPEVVLVRDVEAEFAINLAAGDGALPARAWGRAMAAAVVRTVAADSGMGNVIRYPDEASHLAAFIAEIAAGRPGDGWMFDRFAPLLKADPAATLRAVLDAHSTLMAAVVGRLSASRELTGVLNLLDSARSAQLWAEAIARTEPTASDPRPFFAAALTVIAALGWEIDRGRADAAFAAYRAGLRAEADWSDRGQIADATAHAVRFLVGHLGLSWPPAPSALADATAALDWLDSARLAAQLLEPASVEPTSARRIGPTHRQRHWLAALLDAAPRVVADLDRGRMRSRNNALLLFGAVTADRPSWVEDPALPGFIDGVLAAAAGVLRLGWPGQGMESSPGVLRLGEPAAAVVRALVGKGVVSVGSNPTALPTAAAGLFLLLRAADDLRLAALAARTEYPTAGSQQLFLAALAARWAGLPLEGVPDPAILLFAGIDPARGMDELQADWSDTGSAAARFQRALAHVLLGQRLFESPTRLRADIIPSSTGQLLAVAGDENLRVWPFAAPIESAAEAEPLLARWCAEWHDLTGTVPTIIHPAEIPSPMGFPSEVGIGPPLECDSVIEATTDNPYADATLAAVANAGVRSWARWLKHVGHSSTGYLLDQLIRRPGSLIRDGESLIVDLEPRPLDIALGQSGYLSPIERPRGSMIRRVRFRIGGVE